MDDSRWIAYELHDGLMQWVIGARMHMAALTAALKDGRPPQDLQANLMQILSFLNQATEEGRQLIRFVEGLPAGDAIDVVQTLHATCGLLTRKAVDGRPAIDFQSPTVPWPTLAVDKAWPVVRIIQQAVMNAVRHSQGDHVVIQLTTTTSAGNEAVGNGSAGIEAAGMELDDQSNAKQPAAEQPEAGQPEAHHPEAHQPECNCANHRIVDGELVVTVSDDGRGFDFALEPTGHFGLKSMRSRAREAGLKLSIESTIGVGSVVTLRIPYQR